MTNIRATIQKFDDSEKVVNSIDTLGGSQQVTFLSRKLITIKNKRQNISKGAR